MNVLNGFEKLVLKRFENAMRKNGATRLKLKFQMGERFQ